MIETRVIDVPARRVTARHIYCDICGATIVGGTNFDEIGCGELYYLMKRDDTIELYGERMDVCATCLREKVIPLLIKVFGASTRKIDERYD